MKKESQNIVEAWGQPMTEYIADPGCLRLLFYALPAATEMLIDEGGKKSGMKTTESGIKTAESGIKSGMKTAEGGPKSGLKTNIGGPKTAEGGPKSSSEIELYFDIGNRRIAFKEDSSMGKIYLSVHNNKNVSTRELISIVGINRSAILKHIETLKKYGIITRLGPLKGGHWECIEPDNDGMKGDEQ